jgi:hypothetical protein
MRRHGWFWISAASIFSAPGCGGGAPLPPSAGVEGSALPDVEKAGVVLDMANSLEKARKPTEALDAYRLIVREYPGTPQAKTAVERVKALSGR